jgi:hypothetical protein
MIVWFAGLNETAHIPDVVLIQLILLMMGTWLPETCREQKFTCMRKNCVSGWLFTKTVSVIFVVLRNFNEVLL